MIISSTILARNNKRNFHEILQAEMFLICVVQDAIDLPVICEINRSLKTKNLGYVLPICHYSDETAFTVVINDLEKALKLTKRLLWENGFLLSTKIVLIRPEIKLLKNYGECE